MIDTHRFQDIITHIVAADTASDPATWSPENPLAGHCVVVSLLTQDVFGGTLARYDLSGVPGLERVRSHYVNVFPDGREVDFTRGQFPELLPPHLPHEERTRDQVLGSPDTQRRYMLLKGRFEKLVLG